MIITPLGPIKLYVNEKEIEYKAVPYILDHGCRDLNGRYLIHYEYKTEYQNQRIKCCLPSIIKEGDIESGERVEAISFYDQFTKVTIGIEASFDMEEDYGYDYSGSYFSNGLEYVTYSNTESQTLLFAVSWIRPYTEENEYQTTNGADPYTMNPKTNKLLEIDGRVMEMWHDILLKLNDELGRQIRNFKGIALNYVESPVKIIINTKSIEESIFLIKNEIILLANSIIEKEIFPDIEEKYATYEIVFEEL